MNTESTTPESGYTLVCALFVRLLGGFYLIAFLSLAVQIEGLVGSHGILPLVDRLEYLSANAGWDRYLLLPTLFWVNAGDAALVGAAWFGALLCIPLILGRLGRPALLVAFLLYLSLYHAGEIFLNFQWDGLLLESGFLALFLHPNSRLGIFLFRWLLFRLRFMSGLSKLVSGDLSWSGLTALEHYFEVQPLPTPLAWYAHHLPEWMLRLGTVTTLGIELLVPLMMFLPRTLRLGAAWITIFWQVLIILTSNHNWFNFLTIALCLFLFDDAALRQLLPRRLQASLLAGGFGARVRPIPGPAMLAVAGMLVLVSSVQFWELGSGRRVEGGLATVINQVEAFRVSNKYHVFPTMKTERVELEISGSIDGQQWQAYGFRYKPDRLDQAPVVVIPHQPRLDWMLWFVTLHPNFLPWFDRFLQALLVNSPSVTDLLENPFSETPPQYIRVEAFRYRFTTPAERSATGNWWQREPLGPFSPLPWAERRELAR